MKITMLIPKDNRFSFELFVCSSLWIKKTNQRTNNLDRNRVFQTMTPPSPWTCHSIAPLPSSSASPHHHHCRRRRRRPLASLIAITSSGPGRYCVDPVKWTTTQHENIQKIHTVRRHSQRYGAHFDFVAKLKYTQYIKMCSS